MSTSERNISELEKQWVETKTSFNRALRSTDDFHALYWVWRLFKAGLGYVYFKMGLEKIGIHRSSARSYIPFFAVLLIVLVLLSYFGRLRLVILERRCCDEDREDLTCVQNCSISLVHDSFVCYIGTMILFNYISACFRSPGVSLAAEYNSFRTSEELPSEMKWTAANGQGGCCGLNSHLDLQRERSRVAFRGANEMEETEGLLSNEWTFCEKCKSTRPPRTHHCSVCNRCIIRFDHHCVWLNNCVGYDNYRQFLLSLFFLSVGCCYGVAVLARPFFEPLKKQVQEHGFRFLYNQNTGFLNIPPIPTLVKQAFSNSLEDETIVKLVFPLLLSVGLCLTVFFLHHVFYVLTGRTALEHRIIMEKRHSIIVQNREVSTTPTNPFDFGWYQNLQLVLGPNFFLAFLPIPVAGRFSLTASKKD